MKRSEFNRNFNQFFGSAESLQYMIGVLVPSTMYDQPLPKDEFSFWVDYIASQFAKLFGASSVAASGQGVWDGIHEDHVLVYSYMNELSPIDAHALQALIGDMQRELQQACIAIVVNGELKLYNHEVQLAYQEERRAKMMASFEALKLKVDGMIDVADKQLEEIQTMKQYLK